VKTTLPSDWLCTRTYFIAVSRRNGVFRLQQQGWIAAKWGVSENNRKARFYSITKAGLRQLTIETENWERLSGVITRVHKLQWDLHRM
jgi:DNA-binding PadR family transcriptional regulator